MAERCIWSIKGRAPIPGEVESLLESWRAFDEPDGEGRQPDVLQILLQHSHAELNTP